jgi:hypothetical protein
VHARSAALALALSAGALAHCRAFDRDRYRALLDADSATTTDASEADAAGACLTRTVTSDGGACVRAVFPERPAALSDQPGDGRTYALALRRIEIGPGGFGNWRQIGFDRDGLCTNAGATASERSCLGMQLVTDGDEGRDNAFASVIGTSLFVMDQLRDSTVNETLETGRLAHGLRITEWGGGEDARVRVEWLGLVNGRGPMGSAGLAWDGRDTWSIDPGLSFAPDGVTPLATDDGYVACGSLGAQWSSALTFAVLSRDRVRLARLERVVMAGSFSPDRGGTVDLSGVWRRSDVIAALPYYDVCPPPVGDANDYRDRVAAIDRAFDVRSTLAVEPMLACDSATFAVRLTFAPVRLDGAAPTAFSLTNPCTADAGAPVDP